MFRVLWVLPLCLILHGQDSFREVQALELSEVLQVGGDPVGMTDVDPLDKIIKEQPQRFLQMCLDRYDREVKGYSCTFRKQERVNKKLRDAEKIHLAFREEPFSVHFDWQQGAGLAKKCLYVAGQNKNLMQVRPNFFFGGSIILSKDPDSGEAKASSRYTIKEFGLKFAMQRTLDAMKRADQRGALHVRYEGVVKVAELDNLCYKFVRTPYDPPEEEGVNELVFYIDKDNWLQVGSILRDVTGNVIAEYYFYDLKLNPTYPADQFTAKKL